MIPCAKNCKHQSDGYCALSGKMTVTSLKGECPHFVPDTTGKNKIYFGLTDKPNGLTNGFNINKLNR